jgi:predicted transcriptional regulator of viral defense system
MCSYYVHMSTLQKNITAKRIAILGLKGEKLFHTKDAATLWGIGNENTLRVTLKRYCDGGLLYRVYKGLYSLIPPSQIDPILLGAKALHQFSYLSTESVLFQEGYLSQVPYVYTYVSLQSKNFNILSHHYKSRQLKRIFLYNPVGISEVDGVKRASPERAIADLLYFHPKKYFDKQPDWEKVKRIQEYIRYPLTPKRYALTKT